MTHWDYLFQNNVDYMAEVAVASVKVALYDVHKDNVTCLKSLQVSTKLTDRRAVCTADVAPWKLTLVPLGTVGLTRSKVAEGARDCGRHEDGADALRRLRVQGIRDGEVHVPHDGPGQRLEGVCIGFLVRGLDARGQAQCGDAPAQHESHLFRPQDQHPRHAQHLLD